jgi:hypothetical protein
MTMAASAARIDVTTSDVDEDRGGARRSATKMTVTSASGHARPGRPGSPIDRSTSRMRRRSGSAPVRAQSSSRAHPLPERAEGLPGGSHQPTGGPTSSARRRRPREAFRPARGNRVGERLQPGQQQLAPSVALISGLIRFPCTSSQSDARNRCSWPWVSTPRRSP